MRSVLLLSAFVATLSFSVAGPLEKKDIVVKSSEALSLTAAQELSLDFTRDRNAIRNKNGRWPNGIVYYVISNEYSSEVHNVIIEAMREIERDVNGNAGTCVQFQPRTSQANYIYIHKGTGCHSIVGYVNQGEQEVSIGVGCEIKGVIMHELIHTLGFFHEQNRYDRDQYLEVIESNVPANEKINFALLSKTQIDTYNQPYSFDSIMHYGAYGLAKDKSKPVIRPRPGKYNTDIRMGQRLGLVSTDVKKIQMLYECPVDASHIASFKKAMVSECNFEKGMCNLKPAAGDFKFTVHKGVTGAGPHAGNTNGADKYLLAKAARHNGKVGRFVTPLISKGSTCLDFFLFQKGPTSYLDLYAAGPRINQQKISTTQGKNKNEWYNFRFNLNVPAGVEYQVIFEAHMGKGDIAIDDFNMYLGACI